MIGFLGEYEATVDAKGRFLLPAGFKRKLPEGSPGTFVISRGFEECLTLYPMATWEPLYEQLSKLNDFESKVRDFKRYFLNGATEVEMDTAGRLLIPPNLKQHASIGKDIILAGYTGKIEICDVNKRKEIFDSITSERFSQLANEVWPFGAQI